MDIAKQVEFYDFLRDGIAADDAMIVMRVPREAEPCDFIGWGNTSHMAAGAQQLLIGAIKMGEVTTTECHCAQCARALRQMQAALAAFERAAHDG